MGGRAALEDRASTPHHQPRRTSDRQVQAIWVARQTASGRIRVHVDVKRLARIVRVGHGNRSLRVYGAGREYAHVGGRHSRVAYTEVLADQTGRSVEVFLHRTVRWFAQRGTVVTRARFPRAAQ